MPDDPFWEDVTFGGDRMTITEDAAGTATITFDDRGTGRVCGSCTLCCKLIPVPPLNKPAGVRCRHQSFAKGCVIYASRPTACRAWSCRWIADPACAGMPRPDRCHYVIDVQYDTVQRIDPDGREVRVQVAQVWVDSAFPDAWRTPALRAYMERLAEQYRMATILRFNQRDTIVVFPPALTADGQWHEVQPKTPGKAHAAPHDAPGAPA